MKLNLGEDKGELASVRSHEVLSKDTKTRAFNLCKLWHRNP